MIIHPKKFSPMNAAVQLGLQNVTRTFIALEGRVWLAIIVVIIVDSSDWHSLFW